MKVNHILIGAGRSGTTSLVEYLKQHPDVNFSSIKEVTYFSVDDHYKRGEDFLHSFFEGDGRVNSTSDTYLLISKEAPKRILSYNPDVKLSIILRDPSERTFSNFNFSVNHGYIKSSLSLIDSLKKEESVLQNGNIIQQNNHCNFYGSLYHEHLSYWLNYFNRDQIFICTTSELKNNPQDLMDRYFEFLGLDKITINKLEAQHKAAGVKNKSLDNFLSNRDHWLRNVIRKPLQFKPIRNLILNSSVIEKIKDKNKAEQTYRSMTDEDKAFCNNYFREDLKKLKEEFLVEF